MMINTNKSNLTSLKFFRATSYQLILPAFIFLRVHGNILLQSAGVHKEPNQARNTGETFGKHYECSKHGYGRQEWDISIGKFKT